MNGRDPIRLLMVGPWRLVAMRRHMDWAVENDIEVCVADFRVSQDVVLPAGFHFTSLLPRRAKAIDQPATRKNSGLARRIATLRLRDIAASFQPDLVHSYMLDLHTELCLAAGLQPLVVSAWGYLNGLMTTGATAKDRRWLGRLRQGAHTLLVENPNLLDSVAALSGPPLHVACFPIGVDGSVFHPGYQDKSAAWRFVLDIPADASVLLSPRGWSLVYGQHHIMKAFALAYRRLDVPLILTFVGMGRQRNPEAYAQEVLDLGASLGVAHAIRWIPQVPYQDMPGLYALADVVINYPSSDAFPSTLLEAAACARPVITSHLPAYRNTFVEECFRLVEPENPEALAEAIVEVVGSGSAFWSARAQSTRAIVTDEYDESVQKERLITLYRQVVHNQTTHDGNQE
jgi:glycosyltransferase involved in cell wall biosynthesis